jgi:hypothetical protein
MRAMPGSSAMPSLFRFTVRLVVIGLIAYVGMHALADLVVPQEREIVAVVPLHPKPNVKPVEHGRTRAATKAEPGEGRQLFSTLESLSFVDR